MTNNKVTNGKLEENKFEQYRKKPVVVEAYQTDVELEIETLEGTMKADKGDYIIKGVKGEPYPCKPDIFHMTYEEVSDDDKSIDEYFNEWENLLEVIADKSDDLYILKNILFEAEQEIINNTDFKSIYGKNNTEVRKLHLHNELRSRYDAKFELEHEIDTAKRRIEYIKSLMNMNRSLIDAGVIE